MGDELRVGMIIPFSGPGGQYGPSAQAVTELAMHDINGSGGIAGHEVAPVWIDGGKSPDAVASEVDRMIDEGNIDAVSGWHTSAVRESVAPIVIGRVPYVYPALHEGGEAESHVLFSGESPDDQIIPAVRWLRDYKCVERWAIVGDDYIWPRQSAAFFASHADDLGVEIVAQRFIPQREVLEGRSLARICEELSTLPVQGLLLLMVGQNAALFNREFARHLELGGVARFCPLMDENTLLASGRKGARRLFTAGGYFSSMNTEGSLELVEGFEREKGPSAPVLSNTAESCYEGLIALKAMLERGPSKEPLSYHGPRGLVSICPDRAIQPIYIAEASDFGFEILGRIA